MLVLACGVWLAARLRGAAAAQDQALLAFEALLLAQALCAWVLAPHWGRPLDCARLTLVFLAMGWPLLGVMYLMSAWSVVFLIAVQLAIVAAAVVHAHLQAVILAAPLNLTTRTTFGLLAQWLVLCAVGMIWQGVG